MKEPLDYEPLRRTHSSVTRQSTDWLLPNTVPSSNKKPLDVVSPPDASPARWERIWVSESGHLGSYIGLFLFTTVVYFRPYELFPALRWASTMAFWIAVATLVVFVFSQLSTVGKLTIRIREVNLILLLGLAGLLSVPLADDVGRSWKAFNDFIKIIVMFIVMVNVVRTRQRLMGLLFLVLAVSCYLSFNAFSDYWAGILKSDGYRVVGSIGNMFQNPNDLALHLVTIIPIAIGLLLTTRNIVLKVIYALCAVMMIGATTLTYSRGGFIGLVAIACFLVWRLGRRNRFLAYPAMVVALVLFIAFAPGGYGNRIKAIGGNDGSAVARTDDLKRSIIVMLRHPLFGVGMDNYVLRSNTNTATHNAYTQVGADMGIFALVVYTMLIIAPLNRLRHIERETVASRGDGTSFFYLAVGLQASLIGYMVCSFFASVCYLWNVYYLVGYAICLHGMYLRGLVETANAKRLKTSNLPDRSSQSANQPVLSS